jgi:endonuclease/exonuclease/phosphatase (EEP) superfamily protein YafD
MHGAFVAPEIPPQVDARAVRVVEFNIHIGNDDMAGVAAYLESLTADVAVLAEVSPRNAEQLTALLPRLPHQYRAESDGVWGVVILSRWPLIAPQPAKREGLSFAARADVDFGDRKLRLYGAHLKWPVMPATAQTRNAQLEAIGRELAACPHACVVVGDFNVTPWSSHFRDLLDMPFVHDCAAGRGLSGTWPTGIPAWLRIHIDQCLVAGAVTAANVVVGEGGQSDHLATINDLLIGRAENLASRPESIDKR